MKKQKSDFQQRYERWKNGEKVYKNGRPVVNIPVDAPWSYTSWVDLMEKYKGINIQEDPSYDYNSFFNDNPSHAWSMLNDKPDAHFTDKYKTAFHPSASDLSVYNGVKDPMYNSDGVEFGRWDGDHSYYAPQHPQVSWEDIENNAVFNEPGGLTVRDYEGRLPYHRGDYYFGGSLPLVEVVGSKRLLIPKFEWNK